MQFPQEQKSSLLAVSLPPGRTRPPLQDCPLSRYPITHNRVREAAHQEYPHEDTSHSES